MTNEIQMTKPETLTAAENDRLHAEQSILGIRHSGFLRHSSFVICASSLPIHVVHVVSAI
jgi:hypothetical protein